MNAILERTTFSTSRLLDFFSEKELTMQIGHPREQWPVVILKELVDNALDACEDADTAPEISVSVDDTGIMICDNGPGIVPKTIEGMLDYSVRVSSREAYVSPDRGAQGNALKTLVAMPYVLNGDCGRIDITAHGARHEITVELDRIRQEPRIHHNQHAAPDKEGTAVRLYWPDLASSMAGDGDGRFLQVEDSTSNSACSMTVNGSRFLQVARDFAWLNPHLTLNLQFPGHDMHFKATDIGWRKWRPNNPTSAYWYTPEHLSCLIAAYIGHDDDSGRSRTVREFVAEFRGLSGTAKQKQVTDALGLSRSPLSALAPDSQLDMAAISHLLDAMKTHSKEPKAAILGAIGKEHLWSRISSQPDAQEESFNYRKQAYIADDGVPRIVETAFCHCPGLKTRQLVTGVNWSPGIVNPFRELGEYGTSLDSVLTEYRASAEEPIVLFLHMSCPRIRYGDRGKSSIILGRE